MQTVCSYCHQSVRLGQKYVAFKKFRTDNILQYEYYHRDCWDIVAHEEAHKAFKNRERDWIFVPKPKND